MSEDLYCDKSERVGHFSNEKWNSTHNLSYKFPKLDQCFKQLPDLKQFNDGNKMVYKLHEEVNTNWRGSQQSRNKLDNVNKYQVYMPFSRIVPGYRSSESYWKLIQKGLDRDFGSAESVEQAIKSYNKNMSNYSFDVLKEYEKRYENLYLNLLNDVRKMALRLKELLPESIPFLKQGTNSVMFLSQKQICCLLANSFFCTFPWRGHQNQNYPELPVFNMTNLFSSKDSNDLKLKLEKLRCLFNYFERVIYKRYGRGIVSFERQCLNKPALNWKQSKKSLTKLKFEIGMIEQGDGGYSEVDFANKYIGGGVITSGSVQEEIRFLCSPELIVSRLFTESLSDDEALIITGAEQYNKCEGYSKSFRFQENYEEPSLCDKWGRRLNQIIAIDAFDFKTMEKSKQFEKVMIDRELNKALSGFMITDQFVKIKSAIATGKWGCGVFNGNPHLKCLIQIMAAAEAGRDLIIYTFNDQRLKSDLDDFYNQINQKDVTVGQIYDIIISFQQNGNQLDNILVHLNNSINSRAISPNKSDLIFIFNPKEINNPKSLASNPITPNELCESDNRNPDYPKYYSTRTITAIKCSSQIEPKPDYMESSQQNRFTTKECSETNYPKPDYQEAPQNQMKSYEPVESKPFYNKYYF